MKKFLLGTTALISMSAASAALAGGSHAPVAAAPANTGGLTVMVGGFHNFQYAYKDQGSAGGPGSPNSRDGVLRNDTEIHFTAAGSTENFDYGAVVEMNANTSADKSFDSNGGTTGVSAGEADKAYIFVESDAFGRFEGGSNSGASETLDVDASRIARATGGIDGDWRFGIIDPVTGTGLTPNTVTGGVLGAGTGQTNFITRPNLPVAADDGLANDANKVTYYTPRFSGFQFGVSFTPDSADTGTSAGQSGNNAALLNPARSFENVFAGGVNFEGDVADGVSLMASAVGETGDAENTAAGASLIEDLNAYALGLGVEFGGFSIAGSWADLSDSGQPVAVGGDKDQNYWTAGAAYENGPYGVSVTYMDSQAGAAVAGIGSNDFNNLVVGADYQMAPGLVPYVEASFYDLDPAAAATPSNSGNVLLVGANLSF